MEKKFSSRLMNRVPASLLTAFSLGLWGGILAPAICRGDVQTYQMSGTVTQIEPGKLIMESAGRAWELTLPKGQGTGANIGDEVTVSYTLSVEKLARVGGAKSAQQPGQVPNKPLDVPGEIIRDDRTMYGA